MSADIHVGDVGTVFEANLVDENGIAVDLSTATTKTLSFRKPDGSTVLKVGTTSATVGRLEYAAIAGDLDQAGQWRVQADVIIPGVGEWHSDQTIFDLLRNLT
jgi:hypothetical protein